QGRRDSDQRLTRRQTRTGGRCIAHRVCGGGAVMLYTFLYEFLYPFNAYWSPLKVFNVVGYLTFRTAYATITALLLGLMLGPWLIRRLREFQIGQHIREEGPKSHQKKAGTPTMGGLLIVISIVLPTILWANL